MPRDLGDVLHYFIPEASAASQRVDAAPEPFDEASEHADAALAESIGLAHAPVRPRGSRAHRIATVPLGERDVLRATFVWNLAVEMTAQGAPTTVIVPSRMSPPVWPEPGRTSMGSELVPVLADGFGDLARAALDLAATRASDDETNAQILVCAPPAWLKKAADGPALLRHVLLFASPEPTEIIETYALAKFLFSVAPEARIGLTVYGVPSVEVAARTFDRLAGTVERHHGCELSSYGLLVDEIQIYRAIVDRRPIGLSHPQSRAARSLRDVARLLLDDVTTGWDA